jgi:hypothetical protein
MKTKRRIFIILISVGIGSLISLLILKKRMGTLNASSYMQLTFNFLFATAVVVGIALLLKTMNDRNDPH